MFFKLNIIDAEQTEDEKADLQEDAEAERDISAQVINKNVMYPSMKMEIAMELFDVAGDKDADESVGQNGA